MATKCNPKAFFLEPKPPKVSLSKISGHYLFLVNGNLGCVGVYLIEEAISLCLPRGSNGASKGAIHYRAATNSAILVFHCPIWLLTPWLLAVRPTSLAQLTEFMKPSRGSI